MKSIILISIAALIIAGCSSPKDAGTKEPPKPESAEMSDSTLKKGTE
ncbi:MAG: hypothetical protein JNK63_01845 [Chthonomonas sp.]|nr:hypothetical protein [Chthonomonas sp.]